MNSVIGTIEKVINGIVGGVNTLLGGFNKVVSAAAKITGDSWSGVTLLSTVSLGRISVGSYKNGGYPDKSSLFWAGENGVPELLGTVNGQTAVASGNEITGIADAVYRSGQTEADLLKTAVNLLQIIADKDTGISDSALFSSVQKSARDYNKRTGNFAFT
jgi:hypothetical protein